EPTSTCGSSPACWRRGWTPWSTSTASRPARRASAPASSAAGTSAPWLAPCAAAACTAESAVDSWPGGLSTGCFFQRGVLGCLKPIGAAGFPRIEVCSFPSHLDYHDRAACERAAARIRELAITAESFHAPFAEWIDITALDAGERQRALAELLRAAEAAAVVG